MHPLLALWIFSTAMTQAMTPQPPPGYGSAERSPKPVFDAVAALGNGLLEMSPVQTSAEIPARMLDALAELYWDERERLGSPDFA